jgi:hypothetical protein
LSVRLRYRLVYHGARRERDTGASLDARELYLELAYRILAALAETVRFSQTVLRPEGWS